MRAPLLPARGRRLGRCDLTFACAVAAVAVLGGACASTREEGFVSDKAPASDAGGQPDSTSSGGSFGPPSGSDAAAGPADPHTDVEVVITADNAYEFAWGDEQHVGTLSSHAPSTTAGEIFNCGEGPEGYTIPASDAPPGAYLYVVAWADYSVTQGVIGQFKRVGGETIYTGNEHFQVCATGVPYVSPAPGPDAQTIDEQIAICNAGTGDPATTSGGWVDVNGAVTSGAVGTLAVGPDNGTSGSDFPQVCLPSDGGPPGIDTAARWMWYAPPGVTNPFHYDSSGDENSSRLFLIFRLPTTALPPPVK
jgi:hypothetical protein